MMRDVLFFLFNQSLLALALFPVFCLTSYWIKKSRVADWRNNLWTFYFFLSSVPFQNIKNWFFLDENKNIQWIKLSEGARSLEASVVESTNHFKFTWVESLTTLWALGFLASIGLFVLIPCLRELRALRSLQIKEDKEMSFLFKDEKIYLTDKKVMPFVSGVFFPKIIFSRDLFAKFNLHQLEGVFFHEVAHKKSLDPLRLLFARFVSCFFWFHPCILYSHRKLLESIELKADGFALSQLKLGQAVDYVKTLADMISIQQKENWNAVGLGVLTKNQIIERILAMKHSQKRKKPNIVFPLLILAILFPFSFSIGGVSSKKHEKIINNHITVVAKVFHQGKMVARPTIISELGKESQIVMGDEGDRGTWFLKLTVFEEDSLMDGRGEICFTISKFEPGHIPKCKDKHTFQFSQKEGVPWKFSIGSIPYEYEFVIHRGVHTQKFLKHLDKSKSEIMVHSSDVKHEPKMRKFRLIDGSEAQIQVIETD